MFRAWLKTGLLAPVIFNIMLPASFACANEASIVDVTITEAGGNNYFRVSVTIAHDDEGWDHYANRWDVLDENGGLLGSRTLHHPHVNEQPFTRSLALTIPPAVKMITIVASDSVHGDNDDSMSVLVPGR